MQKKKGTNNVPVRNRVWERHKAELKLMGYTYIIMGIVMAIITLIAVVVAVKGG